MDVCMTVVELESPAPGHLVVDVESVESGMARLHLLGPDGQFVEGLTVPLEALGACIRGHAARWGAGTLFLRGPASLPLTLADVTAWMRAGAGLQAAE